MRYGTQYTYRCPSVSCRGAVVHPYALPAAAAIDWTLPAGRIGDRSKPLRPKTLARIEHGLRRHGSAMLVPSGGTWNSTARPTTTPMRARTTRETEALLVPVEARTGKQARTTADPMRAQTARAQDALVVPLRNTASPGPPRTHPLVTFAAGGTHQGLIMRNNTGGAEMSTPLEEPLRALTTAGHQSLVRWDHLTYAYDTGTMRPVARRCPPRPRYPATPSSAPPSRWRTARSGCSASTRSAPGWPSPTAIPCSAPNARPGADARQRRHPTRGPRPGRLSPRALDEDVAARFRR
jgi:DNA (cytosine-5)-methyltransferase 1